MLSPDTEQYYLDLEETFATNGWRRLVKEFEQEIYQLQADSLEAKSWDDLNVAKGKASLLAYLTRLPEVTAMQKQAHTEDDDAAPV